MSIDIGLILSSEDEPYFAAQTEAVTAAMQQVQRLHPAYNWVHTDEIRCRGCNGSIGIPPLASTNANADKAFLAHRAAQVDAIRGLAPTGEQDDDIAVVALRRVA